MTGHEIEELVEKFTDEIFEEAEDVYCETMCGPAGCCGDLYGAVRVAIRLTIKRMNGDPA